MKSKGFTLIELLVVVLIIGILAAIAVPQYQKAVEKSKSVQALSLLKSISQEAEAHYLANGSEITSFDDLAINLPSFTGNSKVISFAQDTKSNGEWSLQLENDSGWVIIWMNRLNGKYKGAGFTVTLYRVSENRHSNSGIGCSEMTGNSVITFDTSLPAGAYCTGIMQADFIDSDSVHRWYKLKF